MKTLKTLLLFTGILLGFIIIFTSPLMAENHELKEAKSETKHSLNLTEILETESILLDNYLQIRALSKSVETIAIVDEDGSTIFTGAEKEAADLINISTYLFEHKNKKYYLAVH